MIHSGTFIIDGTPQDFDLILRYNRDLPAAMQFWTARFAREMLQFGVFLRAAAIMLQVPGGVEYEFVLNEDEEDEISEWVRGKGRRTLLDVFADCLDRLEASPEILKQVPGGTDYTPKELSEEWTAFLDGQQKVEHGLQNVVAEILDKLILWPKMNEIDVTPTPTWWQEWWDRIGCEE